MISEFKLIAFASMIYVLLDHFGGLKVVEKSLKNSGNMIILMGKVSLIIVLLIVAVIFGTKKLRNVGSDLGGAVKGFKEELNEEKANEESDNIDT